MSFAMKTYQQQRGRLERLAQSKSQLANAAARAGLRALGGGPGRDLTAFWRSVDASRRAGAVAFVRALPAPDRRELVREARELTRGAPSRATRRGRREAFWAHLAELARERAKGTA